MCLRISVLINVWRENKIWSKTSFYLITQSNDQSSHNPALSFGINIREIALFTNKNDLSTHKPIIHLQERKIQVYYVYSLLHVIQYNNNIMMSKLWKRNILYNMYFSLCYIISVSDSFRTKSPLSETRGLV